MKGGVVLEKKFIHECVLVSLFASIISVFSLISIPLFGVPVTMQSFAISTALFVIGGKRTLVAVAVYIAIGCVGMPVFSGFSGGFGALFGSTGGFILGFLLEAAVYLIITRILGSGTCSKLLAYIIGHLFLYTVGALWFFIGYSDGSSFPETLLITVLPFVIPDAIKAAAAFFISVRLCKKIKV